MLFLQQLIVAGTTWPGLRERAAQVMVQGQKSGFRSDWKVPDTDYWDAPGVQEVYFVTIASDSRTGYRFKKPYRTIFRFPLDPETGAPYPSGHSPSSLPCWVHCTCPAFQYYCEVALTREQNSDIISSDGSYPGHTNPSMAPYVCKHLFATAQTAMSVRDGMGVTASLASKQDDPRELEPKRRDPMRGSNIPGRDPKATTKRSTPKTPLTAKPAGKALADLPSTWHGRLMYVLFGTGAHVPRD